MIPRHVRPDLEAAGDPVRGHQRGDRDLHDRDVVVEGQLRALERRAQRGLRELAGHEQVSLGHRRRRYLLKTNLLGLPSSVLCSAGRQSTVSSIRRASSKSLR
jgi:hypothetical protein